MDLMPQDPELRPSPDALLKLAGKDARGKLKVFLGAAPGVGGMSGALFVPILLNGGCGYAQLRLLYLFAFQCGF
jgi:hypothetical protein